MIELRVGHTRLDVHPLALLLPLLGMALGVGEALPALLISLTAHEAGHLAAARLCRVRISAMTATPFGCGIQLGNLYALSPAQLFAVSAGGPLASFMVLFADGALCHWGLISPAFALALLRVTMALMLFNLLPALPLDGGRMLYALTAERLGRGRSARLGGYLGYLTAAGLVALTLWLWIDTRRVNITLPACALFILKGISEDRRALSDAISSSLLNALKTADAPIPMRLFAVRADMPIHRALRHAAPDAATLYAVYQGDGLIGLVDERTLMRRATEAPSSSVGAASQGGTRLFT